MADADKMFYAGHRERLKQKLQDDKLTSYEKLELLLTYAIPRRDVRPLARKLEKHFGGVYYVFTAEYDELIAVPGVGRTTAILIKLVCSLMLLNHKNKLRYESVFANQKDLEEFCRLQVAGKTTEELHVLYLNGNFCLVDHEVNSKGSIDESAVYATHIMKRALKDGIKNIVLLHNHPATDNTFSHADIEFTQSLEDALNLCGLRLYDHYVLSGGIFHSMRAEYLLNRSSFNNKKN
jgi:DNA repair protein RadC